MIKYLGKKAMYDRFKAIAKDIGIEIPMMKECEYSFYHGDEMIHWINVERIGDNLDEIEEVQVHIFSPKDKAAERPIMHIWIDKSFESSDKILSQTRSKYTYHNKECIYKLLINSNDQSEEWVKL